LLETESHLYVERAEDGRIAADIRRRNHVALIGARQTGKTSLLLRLRRQLLEEGHMPVYLDLSPARDEDEDAWYGYLRSVMVAQLRRDGVDVAVPPIRDRFDFRAALRQISLELASSRHVVFLIDEVSALPPDIAERFFSIVRTVFNERETFPEFQRYVFVMAGAFIPEELVRQPSVSPFNIASRIYMGDADREGLARLVHNLERVGCAVSDEVIDRMYHWTGGHLYLTQRLCSILETQHKPELSCELVDAAIDDVLGDQNVRRVYEKLDQWPEEREVLERILAGREPLKFNRASRLVARLELVGVIKPGPDGHCTARNAIYRKALARRCSGLDVDETGELTTLEQKLLAYFSQNVSKVCSYSEIAEAVWGNGSFAEQGIHDRIYQLVARLRQKMASDPETPLKIVTVRGRGYKPHWRESAAS